MNDAILNAVGSTIDNLLTLDIASRGVVGELYKAARKYHERPLCLLAAQKIVESVQKNDIVFIATGMLIHPFQAIGIGENDGPIGAAGLARSLGIALGAKCVFITDKILMNMLLMTVRGGDITIVPRDTLRDLEIPVSAIVDFPTEEQHAAEEAVRLIDEFRPKALISIERRGVSKNGIYHSWNGYNMSPYEARIGRLFHECRKCGVLTIGIGDGGNEIGMGNIYEQVRQIVPYGDRCNCPENCGIADSTEVDVAIVTTVSNWGAYGIEACLAIIKNEIDALHTREIALRITRNCIDAGGVDGPAKVPRMFIDAIGVETDIAILQILAEIIEARFIEIEY